MAAEQARYRDLKVWQRGMDLVEEVYRLTAAFPREERYGLTSQLRRAASAIPMNIAEGSCRSTRRDYASFISIAMGSAGELETGILIAIRLRFVTPADATPLMDMISHLGRMLRSLRTRLLIPNP